MVYSRFLISAHSEIRVGALRRVDQRRTATAGLGVLGTICRRPWRLLRPSLAMQWEGEPQRSSGPGELRLNAAMAAESKATHRESATEFRRDA